MTDKITETPKMLKELAEKTLKAKTPKKKTPKKISLKKKKGKRGRPKKVKKAETVVVVPSGSTPNPLAGINIHIDEPAEQIPEQILEQISEQISELEGDGLDGNETDGTDPAEYGCVPATDSDDDDTMSIVSSSSLAGNWSKNLFADLLKKDKNCPPAKDPCSLWCKRMTGEGGTKKNDVKSNIEKSFKDIITNLCGMTFNAHTFIREKIRMMKQNPTEYRNVRKYLKQQGHYEDIPKLGEYYKGFVEKSLEFFKGCEMTGELAKQAKRDVAGLPLSQKKKKEKTQSCRKQLLV